MQTLNMHVIMKCGRFDVTGTRVSHIRSLTGNYFVVMKTNEGNVAGFATHEAMLESGMLETVALAAE